MQLCLGGSIGRGGAPVSPPRCHIPGSRVGAPGGIRQRCCDTEHGVPMPRPAPQRGHCHRIPSMGSASWGRHGSMWHPAGWRSVALTFCRLEAALVAEDVGAVFGAPAVGVPVSLGGLHIPAWAAGSSQLVLRSWHWAGGGGRGGAGLRSGETGAATREESQECRTQRGHEVARQPQLAFWDPRAEQCQGPLRGHLQWGEQWGAGTGLPTPSLPPPPALPAAHSHPHRFGLHGAAWGSTGLRSRSPRPWLGP